MKKEKQRIPQRVFHTTAGTEKEVFVVGHVYNNNMQCAMSIYCPYEGGGLKTDISENFRVETVEW
jgi:hypothetical protein